MTDFVLVHSPPSGTYTWQPVADLLRARGMLADPEQVVQAILAVILP